MKLKVSNASSFYFAIEYLEKYSCNYVDIQNDSREGDKYFYRYFYQKRSNKFFPLMLKKSCGINPRTAQRKIFKPLLKLYREVREERREAYKAFAKNPFASNWKIFYFRWKSYTKECWHNGVRRSTSLCELRMYSFFFALYFGFVWCFVYLGIAFWFLIDCLRGVCLDSCRHSTKERAWLEELMSNHPEYECSAVQDRIVHEMEALQDRLSVRFPLAKIQVKVKSTRIKDDYHWQTLKQIMFKISRLQRPVPGISSSSSDANHLVPSVATSLSATESKFDFDIIDEFYDEDDNDLYVPEEDDDEEEEEEEDGEDHERIVVHFEEGVVSPSQQVPMRV